MLRRPTLILHVLNELGDSGFLGDDDDPSQPFGQFQFVVKLVVVDYRLVDDFNDMVVVGFVG